MAISYDFEQAMKVLTDPRANPRQYRMFHFGYCKKCLTITQYRGNYGPEGCWETCIECGRSFESRTGDYLTENEVSPAMRTLIRKLHSRKTQVVLFEHILKERRILLERELESLSEAIRRLEKRDATVRMKETAGGEDRKRLRSGLVYDREKVYPDGIFPDAEEIKIQKKNGKLGPQTPIQIERYVTDRTDLLHTLHVFLRQKNYRFTPLGRIWLPENTLLLEGFLDRFSRAQGFVIHLYYDPQPEKQLIEVWCMEYGPFLTAIRLFESDQTAFKEILKSAKTIEDFVALAAVS